AAALAIPARLTAPRGPEHTGVGDGGGDEPHRTNGVVVAGDHVVDLIGVAVGVGDRHDRDVQLLALVHRDGFLIGIDDEHGRRHGAHALEAADVLLEPGALLFELHGLLLGQLLIGPVLAHALDGPEALETALDGTEVGQGAAEPAVGDVVQPGAARLFTHDVLRLPLRADEQHVPAARHRVAHEAERALK